MEVERLAVGPLLDGYKAHRVFDGGEEPVAQAARLTSRVVLHFRELGDELVPLIGIAGHATDDDQHVGSFRFPRTLSARCLPRAVPCSATSRSGCFGRSSPIVGSASFAAERRTFLPSHGFRKCSSCTSGGVLAGRGTAIHIPLPGTPARCRAPAR